MPSSIAIPPCLGWYGRPAEGEESCENCPYESKCVDLVHVNRLEQIQGKVEEVLRVVKGEMIG